MHQVVIFSSDGAYLGYKEYQIKPAVLPSNEFVVNPSMFAEKEYLTLVNGSPFISAFRRNQADVAKLKLAVKSFIETKAKELRYDDSAELVSYANDHANPSFKKEALAFIEWRSAVYNKFFKFESSKPSVVPTAERFMLEVDDFTVYLSKQG
jgi:hypothetical protein